ncbi:MAG: aspartyl/asparaginyl beta-hydroxylase domain-containing protein [Dongiaceae bacterium]
MQTMTTKQSDAGGEWLVSLGKKLTNSFDRIIERNSLVGTDPLLDPSVFPWKQRLEDNWEVIRDEALTVLDEQRAKIPLLRDLSPDHRRIADDRWKSFFLWGYGYRIEPNCDRCPRTAALVSTIPDLNTALFSILEPGAHIARHRGVTKHLLTCHLGLSVPADRENCRMQVDKHIVSWESGKCLAFDDTYKHEIWNDTPEVRIILLIQVKRPSRFMGRLVGELFLFGVRRSRFVQEARRNIAALGQAQDLIERV